MADEQPRTTLYVLVPPSPLFAAHWSFFMPDSKGYDMINTLHEESTMGRRIHVAGDRLNGFTLEIIREYDVSQHRSIGSRMFPIGSIPATHMQEDASKAAKDLPPQSKKDDEEGGGFIDNVPRDAFERLCVGVEAPGPSLTKVSNNEIPATGKKSPGEVRDCQWWVRQVVKELMEANILENWLRADGSRSRNPNQLVDELPLH